MYSRALFATALLVAFPIAGSLASDEVAPERIREKTANVPLTDADATPTGNAPVTGDALQTARKPDESPFRDIKILPSF